MYVYRFLHIVYYLQIIFIEIYMYAVTYKYLVKAGPKKSKILWKNKGLSHIKSWVEGGITIIQSIRIESV